MTESVNELVVIASPMLTGAVGEVRRKCHVCGLACYTTDRWMKDAIFACSDCVIAVGGLSDYHDLLVTEETLEKIEKETGVRLTDDEARKFISMCLSKKRK